MASQSPTQPNFPPQGYEPAYKYENQFDQPIPRSYPDPLSSRYAPQPHQHEAHGQYTPEQQHLDASASWANQGGQVDNGTAPQSDTKARLRKACDSCSVRKVKCDESGPPCKSCAALDIPCTFNRPSRRRGPPNKHAEAIKRQRIGEDGAYSVPGSSPTHDAAYSLAALATPARLSAESICDIDTLNILINDYFTYIHPLVPVPHEPSFRAAFARREDRNDMGFLALLAAMMEALVASFPRRPRQLFTSEHARKQFPNAGALIDRCHQVFTEARGIGHLDKPLKLQDAAASYLVGMAAGYVFDMVRIRLYFGECVMILRVLKHHERRPAVHDPLLGSPGPTIANVPPHENTMDLTYVNNIDREIGCRLFWLCFVGWSSMRQLGEKDGEIVIPPMSHADKLPQMPLEIDDQYITADSIQSQPPDVVAKITGFNLNVSIFRAFHALSALEMAFGTDELYDWERQRNVIRQALAKVKAATSKAPPELQLIPNRAYGIWPGTADSSSAYTHLLNGRQDPNADIVGLPAPLDVASAMGYPKQTVQYEIQKANIYATQLATRSYLVEKFWNLYEIQDRHSGPPVTPASSHSPTIGSMAAGIDRIHGRVGPARSSGSDGMDAGEQAMAVEREDIIRDLAHLLRCINQVNMEPNGLSFVSNPTPTVSGFGLVDKTLLMKLMQCHKIRQVASTLLRTERSRMETMPTLDAESVNAYLMAFLDILQKLERLGPSRIRSDPHGGGGADDNNDGAARTLEEIEEEELVHWASLREHQERFVKRNGFVTAT